MQRARELRIGKRHSSRTMSELAIETHELAKRYRPDVLAADSTDLCVMRSEIHGFLDSTAGK
jgi:hypothetical protein